MNGFPLYLEDTISGAIVFSDLDGDQSEDMIVGTGSGEVFAFHSNLDLFEYFPVNYQFPISSSPQVIDIDLDGDLEIIAGTSGDLLVVDLKYNIGDISSNSWSLYKGDWQRTGKYSPGENSGIGDCDFPQGGDTNCDQIIDILDIISIINIIMDGTSGYSEYQLWAADATGDEIIDILDIIAVINIIIGN